MINILARNSFFRLTTVSTHSIFLVISFFYCQGDILFFDDDLDIESFDSPGEQSFISLVVGFLFELKRDDNVLFADDSPLETACPVDATALLTRFPDSVFCIAFLT